MTPAEALRLIISRWDSGDLAEAVRLGALALEEAPATRPTTYVVTFDHDDGSVARVIVNSPSATTAEARAWCALEDVVGVAYVMDWTLVEGSAEQIKDEVVLVYDAEDDVTYAEIVRAR